MGWPSSEALPHSLVDWHCSTVCNGACTIASLFRCQPGPCEQGSVDAWLLSLPKNSKNGPMCECVRPGTVGQLLRVGPWKAQSATPGHWAVTFIGIWTGLDDGGSKSQGDMKKAQATSSPMAA